MASKDFLPHKDTELMAWHDRFLANVTPIAATVGVLPADITAVTGDNESLHGDIATHLNAAAAAEQATANKAATVKTATGRIRVLARRIKTSAGYTEAIGDSLGIVGAEDTTDLSTAQPTLKGRAQIGGVEISFDKSVSDGINLYCKRDGESGFSFLARDTFSPYLDNRPVLVAGKAEAREYRACYVQGDQEVGNYSAHIVVTCAP